MGYGDRGSASTTYPSRAMEDDHEKRNAKEEHHQYFITKSIIDKYWNQ